MGNVLEEIKKKVIARVFGFRKYIKRSARFLPQAVRLYGPICQVGKYEGLIYASQSTEWNEVPNLLFQTCLKSW